MHTVQFPQVLNTIYIQLRYLMKMAQQFHDHHSNNVPKTFGELCDILSVGHKMAYLNNTANGLEHVSFLLHCHLIIFNIYVTHTLTQSYQLNNKPFKLPHPDNSKKKKNKKNK
jgi:hypothetical protein